MRNIKNQKGAISLFVILAMLFFLAFMLGVFSITTRRNAAQLEAVRETAKIYSSGIDANAVYDSMLATSTDVVIPISTKEQLVKVRDITGTSTTANYTINGKLYTYRDKASYMLANDIILDLASEIQGKNDIAIYDYMLYDKSKYKINLNNHNIYYKLSDGSLWKCVFYQDIGTSSSSANRFASTTEAGKYYTADKYSILYNGVDEFKKPWTSGKDSFEFLLTYSCNFVTSGSTTTGYFDINGKKYQRWRQDKNPAKESVSDGNSSATASGYTAIHTGLGTGNYWGGLTLSTYANAYINGSVGHGNWFYAVGVCSTAWHSTYGIPTSNTVGGSARECLLFVRAK